MKKRFITKRKMKVKVKLSLFIIISLITFFSCFNFLYNKIKQKIDNETIINFLLDTNFDNTINIKDLANLNSTEFIFKYSLGIDLTRPLEDDTEEIMGDYVEDPAPIDLDEPILYIYNSHQTEGYSKEVLMAYNISPTVMLASYMLREKLNDLGISTIVETANIKDVLNKNNWTYKSSYKASRILLEEAKKNYPSLKYFIDIHRDSSKYEKTTTEIGAKSYAKILFVVGLDYDNYEFNLNKATELNEKIKNINPNLTRGVLKKTGKNVNGIYNQDFSNNTFLIEVGGQYNYIDEVKNTIDILAGVIYEYVNEV
ncbi:MAG: stage II sporulation protein P [Bacilli bacterium]|nr:stage II sporulation protein P [Bacilli bacterium]